MGEEGTHVGDGEPSRRPRYFATVVCETWRPSFRNSPWMRGARKEGWPRASAGSALGCRRRLPAGPSVAVVISTPSRARTRDDVSARWCRASRSGRRVASSATAARAAPTVSDRQTTPRAPGVGGRRVDGEGRESPPQARDAIERQTGGHRARRRAGRACHNGP